MLTPAEAQSLKAATESESEDLSGLFGALSDRGRLKIFKLLLKQEDLCVTEVASVFGISVPAASQQLKILEGSGLVSRERHGQMMCYKVKHQNPLVRAITRLIGK